MKKHLYRTLIIYAALILGVIYIYPTIGWMALSPEARQARLAMWEKEDAVYREPNLMAETWRAVKRWAQFDRDLVINLGLDLQGGIHMIVGLDMDKAPKDLIQERLDNDWKYEDIEKDFQESALQRIRRRVDQFEAKEPLIQAMGKTQIQIQLPGEKDVKRAKELIMKTAFLTFHMAAGRDESEKVFRDIEKKYPQQFVPFLQSPVDLSTYSPYRIPVANYRNVLNTVKKAKEEGGVIPEGKTILFSRPPRPNQDQFYEIYLLDKEPVMTGAGLTRAAARQESTRGTGGWEILFTFDSESGKKFGEVTEANIGKSMAIVVDEVCESAPIIQGRITTQGQITGKFNRETARDLSIALQSGSMPVPLREDFTGVVGASLGTDSIRKGVWSSVAGLILVVLFMFWYYRFSGFVAGVALAMNGVLMLAAFAYFKATLTLPGIAGLILSIGMAVDANVLIYERIREELARGKSLAACVELGFQRATVTILDSNLTTLIAAAVLMQFGSGPILGFAISLSVGVITSMFTGIVVTHALFDLFLEHKWISSLPMRTVLQKETKIPFLSYRNIAFAGSGAVILAGMIAFGFRGSDTFGVDFTNGTSVIVNLATENDITEGQVREALANGGFPDAEVTTYEQSDVASKNRFFIKIGEEQAAFAVEQAKGAQGAAPAAPEGDASTEATETTVSTVMGKALATLCQDPKQVDFEKEDTVGPAVGAQLKWEALQALFFSMIFLIAYMWFRFEVHYALGAVVAVAHDALITIGLIALTGREISLGVVAAVLTIVGYSVNDTIVIFDRVRENLKLYRGRGLTYAELLNLSVNQTLSRTIITNLTVFFVVLALLFFGGPAINDFAFALTVGMIAGTYSTIYIASPVAMLWQYLFGKQQVVKSADKGDRNTRRRRTPSAGDSGEATV